MINLQQVSTKFPVLPTVICQKFSSNLILKNAKIFNFTNFLSFSEEDVPKRLSENNADEAKVESEDANSDEEETQSEDSDDDIVVSSNYRKNMRLPMFCVTS